MTERGERGRRGAGAPGSCITGTDSPEELWFPTRGSVRTQAGLRMLFQPLSKHIPTPAVPAREKRGKREVWEVDLRLRSPGLW